MVVGGKVVVGGIGTAGGVVAIGRRLVGAVRERLIVAGGVGCLVGGRQASVGRQVRGGGGGGGGGDGGGEGTGGEVL